MFQHNWSGSSFRGGLNRIEGPRRPNETNDPEEGLSKILKSGKPEHVCPSTSATRLRSRASGKGARNMSQLGCCCWCSDLSVGSSSPSARASTIEWENSLFQIL